MFLIRYLFSLAVSLGIATILWTQTGPFAWIGGLQASSVGRHSASLTLFLTISVCLLPIGLIRLLLPRVAIWDNAASWGGLTASALVVTLGLAPLFHPHSPIPPGDIADTIAHATFVPTKATLSLAANDGNIDRENQAALSFRNSVPTLYAAIHEPGNENVMGVVAGRETDWQNASVRATPFPNAANTAALASARHAVLVLRPVPFVVRRQLASNGLPVSVFMPTFLWGNHPLAANLPLIVGGGCGVTFFLVILLWPQRDREPPPPPGQG